MWQRHLAGDGATEPRVDLVTLAALANATNAAATAASTAAHSPAVFVLKTAAGDRWLRRLRHEAVMQQHVTRVAYGMPHAQRQQAIVMPLFGA